LIGEVVSPFSVTSKEEEGLEEGIELIVEFKAAIACS
jgi:hypothetical protein